MLFIVLAADRAGALAERLAQRQRHLDYWNAVPGVVMIAGAMLTDDSAAATPKGSAFIIEADSIAAVKAFVAADPFTTDGIFGDDVRIEVLRRGIGVWK